MDLVFTVGQYNLVSMALNNFGAAGAGAAGYGGLAGLHRARARCARLQEKSAFKETYGGGTDTVVLEGFLRPEGSPSKQSWCLCTHGHDEYATLPNACSPGCRCCAAAYTPQRRGADHGEGADRPGGLRAPRPGAPRLRGGAGGVGGGGSLAVLSEARRNGPRWRRPQRGIRWICGSKLPPADGVMQLAAHVSRATTLTEWLDPSVLDETDPSRRDPGLDLYSASGPKPPWPAFLTSTGGAAGAKPADCSGCGRGWSASRCRTTYDEEAFVVHGTMADPRWLDPTVDPNDHTPGQCYMGDPRIVNMMPAASRATAACAPGLASGAMKLPRRWSGPRGHLRAGAGAREQCGRRLRRATGSGFGTPSPMCRGTGW